MDVERFQQDVLVRYFGGMGRIYIVVREISLVDIYIIF